jgi:hypothetical protein
MILKNSCLFAIWLLLHGVVVEIDNTSGKAMKIQRVSENLI